LHAEQGLGDTLQFVRYASMVADRDARMVLEVQPPIVRLMRGLPAVAQVVARITHASLPQIRHLEGLRQLDRARGQRGYCRRTDGRDVL
jgi:hypothetical protein